jgi:hypothetical protein
MKNYPKYAFVILFTLVFTGTQAQIRPGYIFGLNVSTVTLKTNGTESVPEKPVGIHFGGYIEIPVARNFTFQPALLLSAKGSNYTIDSIDYSLSPIYFEVPLMAMYSFGSDAIRISFFGGPYFAFGVGGYKIEQGGEMKSISYGSDISNDLKRFDIGMNFGAGLQIGGLLISAQYGLGISNIAPETPIESEMKNKVIGISISSLFAGK